MLKTAVLPVGALIMDHAKVSGAPSASVDPLPSRVTVVPRGAVRLAPAFAIGAEADVLMVTAAEPLKPRASITVRRTT